jgi:hypothetical protein
MLYLEPSESEFSFLLLLYCEKKVSVVLLPLKQPLFFHSDDCESLFSLAASTNLYHSSGA